MSKKYQIGLDLGVGSIGWAVVDDNNQLIKKSGKNLWGVRLFEEANSALERKTKRRQKRTIAKRSWRLHLLRKELESYVLKEDKEFFKRLKESYKKNEDKYFLFDGAYNDVSFNQEFPTIYHLRLALMDDKKTAELKQRGLYYRLLYLVASDILKTRGNFLIEGQLNSKSAVSKEEIIDKVSNFITAINDEENNLDAEMIVDSIKEFLEGKDTINKRQQNPSITFLKAILGYKFDFNKIIPFGEDKIEVSFKDAEWESKLTGIEVIDSYLLELYEIYSAIRLFMILDNEPNISTVKVKIYNEHKRQLEQLKKDIKFIDEKLQTKYFEQLFQTKDEKIVSYSNYVGKIIEGNQKNRVKKKTKLEDLVKLLINIKKVADKNDLDPMLLSEIEKENYLILPTNEDNRVIPYQIHYNELEVILDNFVKLEQTDESSQIKKNILTIMSFKVPYYVGPLSNHHKSKNGNYWLVKNIGFENEKITPYNFDKVVNKRATNEAFIKKMLRTCTYLNKEQCIQQETILYQTYIFYNTMNKIKIDDTPLTQEQKNLLFDVVSQGSVLTKTKLKKILNIKEGEISGFSKNDENKPLTVSLSAVRKFREIFPNQKNNQFYMNFFDDVIEGVSLIDDNETLIKKDIVKKISENYQNIELNEDQISKLAQVKSNKWGNLSYKFLCELKMEKDDHSGEVDSIINILKNSEMNLMEILHKGRNTERIDLENDEKIDLSVHENLNKYLEEKYISPQARRAIIQANRLIDEIIQIMDGEKPSQIAIEFTREDNAPKKETNSRLNQIKEAYKKLTSEYREVINQLEQIELADKDKLKSKKIYLYFLQLGKDLYTGENINFDALLNNERAYDIDHIFPQSRIKDDSLDNLVLTSAAINGEKGNNYPFYKLHDNQENINLWNYLKDKGLMTKKKFDRLMRKAPLTDQELEDFVNRQKTTLDWINKETADLLKLKYSTKENEHQFIIYAKSRHTTVFRREFKLFKFRELNNLHHAHDAYLNIVIGKLIQKNLYIDSEGNFKTYNYETIIKRNMSKQIEYTKKIFKYIDPLVTKKTVIKSQGSYWKEQIVGRKAPGKGESLVEIKKGMDVDLYGGYTSASIAFYSVLENSENKVIQPIPTYHCTYFYDEDKFNHTKFVEYIKTYYKGHHIVVPIIPVGQKVLVDDVPLLITTKSNDYIRYHSTTQTILSIEATEYLRKMFNVRRKNVNQKITEDMLLIYKINKEDNQEVFEELLNMVKTRREKYNLYTLNVEKKIDYSNNTRMDFSQLSLLEQYDSLITIISRLLSANSSSQGKLFNKSLYDSYTTQNINYKFSIIKESITGFYTKKVDVNV